MPAKLEKISTYVTKDEKEKIQKIAGGNLDSVSQHTRKVLVKDIERNIPKKSKK